jgi:hypothetical protein
MKDHFTLGHSIRINLCYKTAQSYNEARTGIRCVSLAFQSEIYIGTDPS